jgi:cobalt-precorrin-5B (C1)-methyltransferase
LYIIICRLENNEYKVFMSQKLKEHLRRGWTTGACALAASKAAYIALLSGNLLDKVQIKLPNGEKPEFNIAYQNLTNQSASSGIIKDAGDDPDVTDGLLIIARICRGEKNTGITFKAGKGVGTITLPGLPLEPGEPAINPKPREMISKMLIDIAKEYKVEVDVIVEIEVPNGETIAKKTWNPRLGILGGISILGTTGIVIPYSCAAWIHSIHRGIDVAKSLEIKHIAAATGSMSEKVVKNHYKLKDQALIDMGDFVGGLLKYLRKHKIPKITVAGGFAKIIKLSQGAMDLHSSRSEVDFQKIGQELELLHIDTRKIKNCLKANTANQILDILGQDKYMYAEFIAINAKKNILKVLRTSDIQVDVIIIDRKENIIAQSEASNA